MDDYKKLLQKARKELPENVGKGERFVVPKVTGHIQGNRTIVSNFMQIAQTLRRNQDHLLKFVNRELATMGEIKKSAVIFNSKIPSQRLNDKIQEYVDNFVICKTCNKPDTKISKESNVTIMACQACGARHNVASKI
ncbi:translation initiation factor IF-2 subunit beta [Candidatus Woesearchaeota archaeon]|nr:translation initiation factor IF-2 subunit beta [Candidatus Woesearchaeota archaeon]